MVGDEGAKYIAKNESLCVFSHLGNHFSAQSQRSIEEKITENVERNEKNRKNLMAGLWTLMNDCNDECSYSLWSLLPAEILMKILRMMEFKPKESIGKSEKQYLRLLGFLFKKSNFIGRKEGLWIKEIRTEIQTSKFVMSQTRRIESVD